MLVSVSEILILVSFVPEDSVAGDITNPLSLNLYTYCHNEPMNFGHPTGYSDVGMRQLYL